jgi:hypothetical protein
MDGRPQGRERSCALVAFVVAASLCGCSSDDNQTRIPPAGDASTDDATIPPAGDAAAEDATPPPVTDASMGDATAEPSRQFTLVVRDLQTGERVPGACLSYYADNDVPASDSCGSTVTDGQGEVVLPLSDHTRFAYRVYPATHRLGWLESNVPTPEPGATVDGRSISSTAASVFAGLLGRTYNEGTATFLGTVRDAEGSPLQGVVVRAVRSGETTAIPSGLGSTDAMYGYFSAVGLPDGDQPHTNTNGRFVAINMPVLEPGEVVRLVACGPSEGDSREVIGCEETRVFPDTYHRVDLPPTRLDGPTCPDVCP